MKPSTAFLVVAAIFAFAGNSLLARAAIGENLIGPGPFSVIRLIAGATVLLPLMGRTPALRDLPGGLALLVYMVGFSYAYSDLPTATGALILFATVQFTVIGAGYCNGERLNWRGLFGLALAGGGIAWFLLPGAGRPGIASLLMMASAGIAWGFYTMIGRGSSDATGQTARSFFIAALLSWPFWAKAPGAPSGTGVALAIAAGVVTSAFGYALWYRVAPRLGLALVSSSQLATPIVAAVAANILLDEILSWRILVAGALVLGGIALTVSPAGQTHAPRSEPRS